MARFAGTNNYVDIPTPPAGGGGGGGDLVGGIITAVGSVANSLINANAQRKAQARQLRYDKKMADYAYQQNLDMWHLQNAYNTPAAQMQRYQDAGVNPAMIYGSGSGSAGNASSSPTYQAPTFRGQAFMPVEIPNLISMYQDSRMRNAQIDQVRANSENVEQRTLNESVKRTLYDLTAERNRFTLDRDRDWMPEQKLALEMRNKKYSADIEGRELNTARQGFEFQARKEDRPYQAQQLQYDTSRSKTERDIAVQRLTNLSVDELQKRLDLRHGEYKINHTNLLNEQLTAENLYKAYRNQWAQYGVTSADSPYLRVVARMAAEAGMPLDYINPMKGYDFSGDVYKDAKKTFFDQYKD